MSHDVSPARPVVDRFAHGVGQALEAGALAQVESWLSRRRLEWERRLDRLDDYLAQLQKGENDNGE